MSGRGTVVTASPLTITLDSGDAELPADRLDTYAPVVGDRVAWLRLESGSLLVLGKVVT